MEKSTVRWLFDQLWEQPKDKLTWYAILKKAEEKEAKEKAFSELDMAEYALYIFEKSDGLLSPYEWKKQISKKK